MQVDDVFLIKKQAYRSRRYIATFFSLKAGLCRVFTPSLSCTQSLNVFEKISVTFNASGEYKNARHMRCVQVYSVHDSQLFCGFYLNELILQTTALGQAFPKIFETYQCVLNVLHKPLEKTQLEWLLRHFELHVLSSIGYDVYHLIDNHHKHLSNLVADILNAPEPTGLQNYEQLMECKRFFRSVIDDITDGKIARFRAIAHCTKQ